MNPVNTMASIATRTVTGLRMAIETRFIEASLSEFTDGPKPSSQIPSLPANPEAVRK
jgi:hypothetical protein